MWENINSIIAREGICKETIERDFLITIFLMLLDHLITFDLEWIITIITLISYAWCSPEVISCGMLLMFIFGIHISSVLSNWFGSVYLYDEPHRCNVYHSVPIAVLSLPVLVVLVVRRNYRQQHSCNSYASGDVCTTWACKRFISLWEPFFGIGFIWSGNRWVLVNGTYITVFVAVFMND